MPFDTPRTWVAGETVTAAIMNDYVRDQQRESFNYQIIDTSGSVGDMAYAATTSGDLALLTIGSAGQLMRVSSSTNAPEWATMDFVQTAPQSAGAYGMGTINVDWTVAFSNTPRVIICPQTTFWPPCGSVYSVTTTGVVIQFVNDSATTAPAVLKFNVWGFST